MSALEPRRHSFMERSMDQNDVRELADRLLSLVDSSTPASDASRRLLEEALLTAAEARKEVVSKERELAARDREIMRLRELSVTDEVTGLLNRRGFTQSVERALERTRRGGDTGGILAFIDLDSFKQINDSFGHSAGDLVLAAVATLLKRHTRKTDAIGRIGGDEFAVLLTDTPLSLGRDKISRISRMLNAIIVPWNGRSINVRASVGAVTFGAEDNVHALMERADHHMYLTKRARSEGQEISHTGGLGEATSGPARAHPPRLVSGSG